MYPTELLSNQYGSRHLYRYRYSRFHPHHDRRGGYRGPDFAFSGRQTSPPG